MYRAHTYTQSRALRCQRRQTESLIIQLSMTSLYHTHSMPCARHARAHCDGSALCIRPLYSPVVFARCVSPFVYRPLYIPPLYSPVCLFAYCSSPSSPPCCCGAIGLFFPSFLWVPETMSSMRSSMLALSMAVLSVCTLTV